MLLNTFLKKQLKLFTFFSTTFPKIQYEETTRGENHGIEQQPCSVHHLHDFLDNTGPTFTRKTNYTMYNPKLSYLCTTLPGIHCFRFLVK